MGESYRNFVVAHIPQLKYVDWKRVTDQEVKAARLEHTKDLEKMEYLEAEAAVAVAKVAVHGAKSDKYTLAHVAGMYDEKLAERLFENSPPEITVLQVIPGVNLAFKELCVTANEVAAVIGQRGLELAALRKSERDEVAEGITQMLEASAAYSSALVDRFAAARDARICEAQNVGGAAGGVFIEALIDQLDAVRGDLMNLEIDLNTRVCEVTAEFKRNADEIVGKSLETNGEQLSHLREKEEAAFELARKSAGKFFDGYVQGINVDEVEISDEMHLVSDACEEGTLKLERDTCGARRYCNLTDGNDVFVSLCSIASFFATRNQ